MALKYRKREQEVEDPEEDAPKKVKKTFKRPDPEEDAGQEDEDDNSSRVKRKLSKEAEEDADSEDEDERPKKKAFKRVEPEDDAEDEPAPKKKSFKKSDDDDADSETTKVKKKTGFLKTGQERAAMMKVAEEKAEARAEQFGKMWRFYIGSKKEDLNKDNQITFLDGDLDKHGMLDNPAFHEHSLKFNGRIMNFVSCCDDEPDPISLAGREPYEAMAFTVIDHTERKDKEGKKFKHRKKLFVAKRPVLLRLQKYATKHGGLTGLTFTISRTGKKTTNVGDVWDCDGKSSMKELREMLRDDGVEKDKLLELTTPAVYENELVYYTAKELKKMGMVESVSTISSKAPNEDAEDLDEELG